MSSNKPKKITDSLIRIRYLTASGFSLDEARRFVLEHPEPQTIGEQMAILNERVRELAQAVLRVVRLTK